MSIFAPGFRRSNLIDSDYIIDGDGSIERREPPCLGLSIITPLLVATVTMEISETRM